MYGVDEYDKMDKKYNYRDIEFGMNVLNHRVGEDESVREWLQDEEHKQLLEELRWIREGSLAAVGEKKPDVDGEWKRLNRRISRKRMLWTYRVASAVACIGIMVSVGWLWRRPMPVERTPFVMVMPENDNFVSQGVTLVLNNGEEIDLNRENGDVLVQRLPQVIQSITADSLNGLVYSPGQPVPELEGTHTLKVPRGGEYFVVLDDGTKVWLNAETEFRYPVVFGEKERVVELSGEAYFQVHRDEKRPFIVKTAGVRTRVLGTEFNVQAYSSGKENVTLVNGSVAVKAAGRRKEVVLKPSENVQYSEGKLKVSKVDIQKYISWKEGYFYYDNERLEDILTELGRWYNFSVVYENPELKELRFKIWVDRKETFSKVVEYLNEMGKLKIEDRNNCIVVFKE